jgi:hypothetical protein
MKKLALVAVLSFCSVAFPLAAFADSSVTSTAVVGATISPIGVTVVPTGVTQAYTIGATPGYQSTGLTLDGVSQTVVGDVFDFVGDTTDHTIVATASADVQTSTGGGGMVSCSGPLAPGWNVSLPNGGCSTNTFSVFGL